MGGSSNPSGSTVEYSEFNTFQQPGKIKDANDNYQLLKYDAMGKVTDSIQLKSGIGVAIDPVTYTPVVSDILLWTQNIYDSVGNLEKSTNVRDVVNMEGYSQSWQYDVDQLYAIEIKRCGDKTGDGVIDLVTDDPCDVAALTYDVLGRYEAGVNSRFEAVEFRYDDLNRLVRGTDAVGVIRDYSYDDNGNPVSEKLIALKIGNTILPRSIDYGVSESTAYSIIDSSSADYDVSDRLRVSIDAGGNATYYSYNPMGQVESVTNPDNYIIGFAYDGLGRVVSAFDEEGREAKRDLDPIGRLRSLTDANGNSETFSYYDAANDGRLEKQCEAPASSGVVPRCTTFNYDNSGNVIAVVDNASNMTLTTYDALNRPVRLVEPVYTDTVLGTIRSVTRFTYDLLGNLEKTEAGYTDALGLASSDILAAQETNVFDDWGRVLSVTDALGETWTYTYNVSGDLLAETIPFITLTSGIGSDNLTPKTIVREYAYGGLLAKEGNLTYEYNALGQVIEAKGRKQLLGTGYSNNYKYTYDEANRLKTESGGGLTYTYTTSPGGLLEKVDIKRGSATTDTIDYRYDKTSRLQSISYNGIEQVGYAFDDAGRLRGKNYPGSISTSFDYGGDDRLKQILVKGVSSTLMQQDITYDNQARRDTVTENINGTVTAHTYGYDNLSRLTSETIDSQSQTFTYDHFGNRITHTKFDGSTDYYEYDAAHQLKTIRENNASGTVKLRNQFMPNGNLYRSCEGASAPDVTSDETLRGDCDLRDYQFNEYDEFGKLIQSGYYTNTDPITHHIFEASEDPTDAPNAIQHNTEYKYDYAGRRMQVSGFERQGIERVPNVGIPGFSSQWVTDPANQFNEQFRYLGESIYLSYQSGGSASNPEAIYLQGGGVDEPLIRFGSDGSTTNYHQNGRNSVVMTTDVTTSTVVSTQRFDAFGNVQASSGSIAQYGFTGREQDANGMMYYRARYYNPRQGRFTQRDPKGFIDGVNRYAYVRNNPVNKVDPNGTVSISTNFSPLVDFGGYTSLQGNPFDSSPSSQSLSPVGAASTGGIAQLTNTGGFNNDFIQDPAFQQQLNDAAGSLPSRFRVGKGGSPGDASDNTVVSDGNNGIEPRLKALNGNPIVDQGIRLHEEIHIHDFGKAENQGALNGLLKDTPIGVTSIYEALIERRGYVGEKLFLESHLPNQNPNNELNIRIRLNNTVIPELKRLEGQ